MDYYVLYGVEKYGPYESWQDAYFFATVNLGAFGWRIWKDE